MKSKFYTNKLLVLIILGFFFSLTLTQKALAQNVGIQQIAPASRLDVNGNLTIGSGFTGTAAPADGAIIEGDVGIGTNAPVAKLDVNGTWKLGAGGSINDGLYTIRWNWGTHNINSAGLILTLTGTSSILGVPQNAAVFVSFESDTGQGISVQGVWMGPDEVEFRVRCHACIGGSTGSFDMSGTHYTFIW